MLETLKAWAFRLKADVLALWFCYRHPGTPLLARIVAAGVVAYAFSPFGGRARSNDRLSAEPHRTLYSSTAMGNMSAWRMPVPFPRSVAPS